MAKRKKKAEPAMTEEEWLAQTNPLPMVEFVRNHARATPRVVRLYLAVFWDWQSMRLLTPPEQQRLKKRAAMVERWAEKDKPPRGLRSAQNSNVVFFNEDAGTAFFETARAPTYWGERGNEASLIQPHFLREIFGPHPFRENLVAHPDWLTSTVVALATGIYEDRAYDRMPYLADAVQDAGCNDAEILDHLRDSTITHLRGCWVLDLLLQKA